MATRKALHADWIERCAGHRGPARHDSNQRQGSRRPIETDRKSVNQRANGYVDEDMKGTVDRRIKKRRDRSDQAMVQNATLVVDTVAALLRAAAVNDSASIGCVERMLRGRRATMFMRTMRSDERNHAYDLGCQE
jgi:hypothetical protein